MSTIPARLRAIALLAAAATALLLAGCAGAPAAEPAGEEHDDRTQAQTLTVEDAWVKAVDDGMTAAFAVLGNDGHHDIHIVSASSSAAPMIELHEVTVGEDGVSTMREVDGGFVVPAGGSLMLEPGGLHFMFMGVTEPLLPGQEIVLTIEFEDGSTTELTVVVKEFTGGDEVYEGDMDMDMGSEGGH